MVWDTVCQSSTKHKRITESEHVSSLVCGSKKMRNQPIYYFSSLNGMGAGLGLGSSVTVLPVVNS